MYEREHVKLAFLCCVISLYMMSPISANFATNEIQLSLMEEYYSTVYMYVSSVPLLVVI